jgi:hypothetical protein
VKEWLVKYNSDHGSQYGSVVRAKLVEAPSAREAIEDVKRSMSACGWSFSLADIQLVHSLDCDNE